MSTICQTRYVSFNKLGDALPTKQPLSVTHPELAAQWHPTKNGDLTPDQVVAGSHKKFWWKCPEGPDHEWPASGANRVGGKGCPACRGLQVSVTNSLSAQYPDLAAQWHPTKNGCLTPDQVVAGSGKKFWWKCPEGPDHEWLASGGDRVQGNGCPACRGLQVSVTNSLALTCPDLAAQWHPTKNGDLTPADVVAGSGKKFWWKCPEGPDHEWPASGANRVGGKGCPACAGRQVSVTNSLSTQYPDLAAQWHPTKNGDLTPADVVARSGKKFWWKCPEGPDHEWPASGNSRVRGRGCPACAGRQVSVTNSLGSLYPDLAAQWHPTKNGELTPDQVVAGSNKKVWWKCPEGPDHEWPAPGNSRIKGSGCPACAGRQVSVTNSLGSLYPDLAAQWHPTKNGELTPDAVTSGTHKKVWWKCSEGPSHDWEAGVWKRVRGRGCPTCGLGWTLDHVRSFVRSIRGHLDTLLPAELFVLFQQSGLLVATGKAKGFVKALVTGRFPPEQLDRFLADESSLVDQFVDNIDLTLDEIGSERAADTEINMVVDPEADDDQTEFELPIVNTQDALAVLDSHIVTSADEEAVEFLKASATAKIWRHAFCDEERAVAQAEAATGGEYTTQVRDAFLHEYRAAKSLDIPSGYQFSYRPNLMQRRAAVRVRDERRVGNWSGTGAGKTLSAILASRVIGAELTVICCPNSVVDGWRKNILEIYPDSAVGTKTFVPPTDTRPKYLIINFEAFQQDDSHAKVAKLVDRHKIDFVVVDEIHYSKQREADNMSRRRQMALAMIQLAGERNPQLAVLGMSATPVINNLQEGRSLVELITGLEHEDLPTRTTVPNCMRMHQQLVRLGIRWLPRYEFVEDEIHVEVDCADALDEVRALKKAKGSPLALEQILTRMRLPAILEHVQPKTLIYTHYVQGIDRILRDALVGAGWKTGFYTGDDKSGLDDFINGDIDVLIGSSAVGTGVDGLQQVCSRLIVNVLPWTAAEFEQLKGRIYRQGQTSDRVQIVVPITFADVGGERWSWCESKLNRLKFKKSVADAAVDGVVPEGHLRTSAQAYQDVMTWLERLDSGEVEQIARRPITVPLPTDNEQDNHRRQKRYGDFSQMNAKWNRRGSSRTHDVLQQNREEWEQYHTLYRAARADWTVVPFEEVIRWLRQREGQVIGDFGCGEAKIASAMSDRHVVYSFDHVAINDNVIACDMANVPLDDSTLDHAVFCLSLMGANFTDYLREAHRLLKMDGWLHIFEATSRFDNREAFAADLKRLGFDPMPLEDRWKFTYIRATKARPNIEEGLRIKLKNSRDGRAQSS